MSVTVGAPVPAHAPTINNGPATPGQQEPKMTTLFTKTVRKISLALAFDRLVLRRFVHRELRLQL